MADDIVIDYRLEKYAAMGFDHMRSLVLCHTRDCHGVALYWRDVQALVEKVGLVAAYDLLAA